MLLNITLYMPKNRKEVLKTTKRCLQKSSFNNLSDDFVFFEYITDFF